MQLKADSIHTVREGQVAGLSHIGQQSKLQIPDLGSVGGKASKVEAILSAAEGQGGPYKLLTALGEMYTRVFLVEHWKQIAELFGPQDFWLQQ